MPNYCANSLEISHEDQAMMDRVESSFKEGRFLSEFLPCPKELLETMAGSHTKGTYEQELLEFKQQLNKKWFGYTDWYNWQVANWGTKWDVGGGYAELKKVSDTKFSLGFDSAWSPPIEAYQGLEELGFTIRAYYYEGGVGFCGSYEDGFENTISIVGNSDWVIDNVPSEIDEEFAISSSMAEWEEENDEV